MDYSKLATIIPLTREKIFESDYLELPEFLGIDSITRILQLGNLSYITTKPIDHNCTSLLQFEERIQSLEHNHIMQLEKNLDFNWLVQIYHLMNVNHLEVFHNVSLNGLSVEEIIDFRPTNVGGTISFKTISKSALGFIRLFRGKESVVKLTMHSALTIELNLEVGDNKTYTVLFNVLPLSANRHKLFVDIYGTKKPNIASKTILGLVLKIASLITINEDMDYYEKLGKRDLANIIAYDRTQTPNKSSLIHRFFQVYGPRLRSNE